MKIVKIGLGHIRRDDMIMVIDKINEVIDCMNKSGGEKPPQNKLDMEYNVACAISNLLWPGIEVNGIKIAAKEVNVVDRYIDTHQIGTTGKKLRMHVRLISVEER